MRDDQPIGIRNKIIVQQQVEIQGPIQVAAPLHRPDPAKASLDRLQHLQEDRRCQGCPDKCRRIDKPAGGIHAHRLAAVGRRERNGLDGRMLLQLRPGNLENPETLAQVGAKTDAGLVGRMQRFPAGFRKACLRSRQVRGHRTWCACPWVDR